MRTDRQTHRQTDRQTDRHTPMTTRPCGLRRAGNDYPENQLTQFCAVYTVNAIYANGDTKILTMLMAFNDFSMVLTVVVFCTFSVLHYEVTAFVSALINLCYLILNIL